MQILEIKWSEIEVKFWKERQVKLGCDVYIDIYTTDGLYKFKAKENFKTDGRSGGKIVDWIIPHYGDEKTFVCWLCHDILFYLSDEGFSFEFANEFLDKMLEQVGYGRLKRWLVSLGVNSEIGRRAFETKDSSDIENENLASVEWVDK